MTKTLENMFQKVSTWSLQRQDDVAEVLRSMEEQGEKPYEHSKSELAGIEEAQEDVRRNGVASPEEVSAMFKHFGV